VGVGIDLLEIDRLERALARRPRLAERLFTDGERAYAATRARPGMHLAARFCAKEAVAKALQLREWSWRDVEVVGGGDEPPSVRLTTVAGRQVPHRPPPCPADAFGEHRARLQQRHDFRQRIAHGLDARK